MVSELVDRQSEIANLCARHGVRRLEVFGSAAGENFDPQSSDFDFIVEFQPQIDLGPWLEKYFSLRDALATLLGRSVDLTMASAMKNRHFVKEANRTRKLLYGE
jgi:uncharacterized protein